MLLKLNKMPQIQCFQHKTRRETLQPVVCKWEADDRRKPRTVQVWQGHNTIVVQQKLVQ